MLSGIGLAIYLRANGIRLVDGHPGVGERLNPVGVPVTYKTPMSDSLLAAKNLPLFLLHELTCFLLRSIAPFLVFYDYQFRHFQDFSTQTPSSPTRSATAMPEVRATLAHGPFAILGRTPITFLVLPKPIGLPLAVAQHMCESSFAYKELNLSRSRSDANIDAYVRTYVQSMFHYNPSGRMAPEADGGVIDDRPMVHGVQVFRISDASVHLANHAYRKSTAMMAERCASSISHS